MPPASVPVSTIEPVIVLAFSNRMPLLLIVPELVMLLVTVELLIVMPVITAELVQPGAVVLV